VRREELVAVVVAVVMGLAFTLVPLPVDGVPGVSSTAMSGGVFEASAAQAETLVREGGVERA
jgi:hypothetical protein